MCSEPTKIDVQASLNTAKSLVLAFSFLAFIFGLALEDKTPKSNNDGWPNQCFYYLVKERGNFSLHYCIYSISYQSDLSHTVH